MKEREREKLAFWFFSSVNTEAKIGVFSVADQFCTFLLVLPSVGVNLSPRLSPSPESYKLKTISLWHGLRSTCSGHFIFVYLPSANMPALPLAASSNGYRANNSPSNKDDILTTHIYVVVYVYQCTSRYACALSHFFFVTVRKRRRKGFIRVTWVGFTYGGSSMNAVCSHVVDRSVIALANAILTLKYFSLRCR